MYSVMIVDDEKAIRENLKKLIPFEQEGFSVRATAVNGEDALHKMKEFCPDLIFLDVSMPVMDGIGFMKALNESGNRETQVVILSGYSEFEYAKAAMRYGAKAYLTKPLDEDETVLLLREIKKELDEKKRERSQLSLRDSVKLASLLYRGKNVDTSALESCFVLHCVVQSDVPEISVNLLKEYFAEELEESECGFIRQRGGTSSYLMPFAILKEYQGEIAIFARHILYGLRNAGITASVLVDQNVFEKKEQSFRQVFDSHLYEMLTEIFYGESGCLIYEEGQENAEAARLECEEAFLAGLKKSLAELNREEMGAWLETLFSEIRQKKLRLEYLQEIGYRIYYSLMEMLGEAETEETRPENFQVIDWREDSRFRGFKEWKGMLEKQIWRAYERLEENRRVSGMGVVGDVIAYVQQHYREAISIRQTAEQFYVNAAYLGRAFQKATGVGFKQYVNDLRIEEAKRLLCRTDRMIYEIAHQVGFTESKYFIAKFTEAVGETPSEYRKRRGGAR